MKNKKITIIIVVLIIITFLLGIAGIYIKSSNLGEKIIINENINYSSLYLEEELVINRVNFVSYEDQVRLYNEKISEISKKPTKDVPSWLYEKNGKVYFKEEYSSNELVIEGIKYNDILKASDVNLSYDVLGYFGEIFFYLLLNDGNLKVYDREEFTSNPKIYIYKEYNNVVNFVQYTSGLTLSYCAECYMYKTKLIINQNNIDELNSDKAVIYTLYDIDLNKDGTTSVMDNIKAKYIIYDIKGKFNKKDVPVYIISDDNYLYMNGTKYSDKKVSNVTVGVNDWPNSEVSNVTYDIKITFEK